MTADLKIGVLASHRGSNFQTLIDACQGGGLKARVQVAISNNSQSQALVRAKQAGIRTHHLSSKTHSDPDLLDLAIRQALIEAKVDLVLTLGYMKKLGPKTLKHYRGSILNIHPSLLPDYGGHGMYGDRVHSAVITAGERYTGATVHLLDSEYDQGPVVTQRVIEVVEGDTVQSLGSRVLQIEHLLLIETLREIVSGKIDLAHLSDVESKAP